MIKNIKELTQKIDTATLMKLSLSDWRPILANECQVYVFNEAYLGKRFDQINYKFVGKNEAKEILIDNLYALLRFKYFPKQTEEVDARIKDIVLSFSTNLKTTLKKVSFDFDSDAEHVNLLPNSCIAFRNGVYDFYQAKWLFKYDIIDLPQLSNKIYMYDNKYIITWYVNIDFEPLDLSIAETSLEDFIGFMKNFTTTNRNYCFELMYNMSHTYDDIFSLDMFKHLCQILGYTILQSFSQNFVLFVGSGQNGKNSLFDGCFTGKIVPRPAANDLDSIEQDRFITGSLENKAHNIFLESSAKTYTESKMLKAITGSMYQTIEQKGVDKYSGIINCKYIFAANDQEKIKFTDTTIGFKRRINVYEVWYKWDSAGRYLKKGDYYNTKFSDTLDEIKNDILNTIIFIYFGMYGLLDATSNFTKNFEFSYNDWRLSYSDVDLDLKDKLDRIDLANIVSYMKSSNSHYEECKILFYDTYKKRLYLSETMKNLGYITYDDMIKMLEDSDSFTNYFAENDIYINVRLLQKFAGDLSAPGLFTQSLKKLYGLNILPSYYSNQPYVKATFVGTKLRILR